MAADCHRDVLGELAVWYTTIPVDARAALASAAVGAVTAGTTWQCVRTIIDAVQPTPRMTILPCPQETRFIR